MTVQEVLLLSAKELNLPDEVRQYILGESTNVFAKREVESLLHCFNMVENELAMDYLPLYAEEKIITETGAVFYDELARKPIRILGVTDENKQCVAHTIFPEYVKAQSGTLTVRYTYMPEAKALDGVSDYRVQASARLLAYGVAVEYCLSHGLFEDANVWGKKYKQALKLAYKSKASVILRTRRWA